MSGDFDVFIGIAPDNNSWYLRFYLDWDENNENLTVRFDVTFTNQIAERFKEEVLSGFTPGMEEQKSEKYYQSIIQ
jgi:hypothetical protein